MLARFRLASLALAMAAAAPASFAAGAHESGHDEQQAAIGAPGTKPTRTVKIDMNDVMRFKPDRITVSQGETVRLVVSNSGKLKHELVLGTPATLKEHYEMMLKMPGMEFAEPNQLVVDPGKTGELVWRFTKAGQVDFACLQRGHLDAG